MTMKIKYLKNLFYP